MEIAIVALSVVIVALVIGIVFLGLRCKLLQSELNDVYEDDVALVEDLDDYT